MSSSKLGCRAAWAGAGVCRTPRTPSRSSAIHSLFGVAILPGPGWRHRQRGGREAGRPPGDPYLWAWLGLRPGPRTAHCRLVTRGGDRTAESSGGLAPNRAAYVMALTETAWACPPGRAGGAEAPAWRGPPPPSEGPLQQPGWGRGQVPWCCPASGVSGHLTPLTSPAIVLCPSLATLGGDTRPCLHCLSFVPEGPAGQGVMGNLGQRREAKAPPRVEPEGLVCNTAFPEPAGGVWLGDPGASFPAWGPQPWAEDHSSHLHTCTSTPAVAPPGLSYYLGCQAGASPGARGREVPPHCREGRLPQRPPWVDGLSLSPSGPGPCSNLASVPCPSGPDQGHPY